jgi:DNA repair protein RAD57
MSDILHALPDFDVKPYSHLFHSIEKNDITVADLLTLDPFEIARRCPLPLLEVKRLVKDVIEACQKDAGIATKPINTSDELLPSSDSKGKKRKWHETDEQRHMIKTLDADIDSALDGGIHTGYITEIAGESAAGKTQFVMGLLLAAQLPAPHGIQRSTIYISTEAPLNTSRLHQILAEHPFYSTLAPSTRPSLDRILTIPVNDLEAQDHILEFQLPIAVKRYNVGLVVIDSVAANYRAEHSTNNAGGLADRATELAKLGTLLRRIATEDNVAIVVTNQVSDRFDDPTGRPTPTQDLLRASSPGVSSSPTGPTQGNVPKHLDTIMSLDHQSRFFTGWGSEQRSFNKPEDLKTPALGLAWANQIAARIVLKMEADKRIITHSQPANDTGGNLWSDRKKRRYLNVIFCPWAAPTESPVEYEIKLEGIVSVHDETKELLDESLWGLDGTAEDEEYPL